MRIDNDIDFIGKSAALFDQDFLERPTYPALRAAAALRPGAPPAGSPHR